MGGRNPESASFTVLCYLCFISNIFVIYILWIYNIYNTIYNAFLSNKRVVATLLTTGHLSTFISPVISWLELRTELTMSPCVINYSYSFTSLLLVWWQISTQRVTKGLKCSILPECFPNAHVDYDTLRVIVQSIQAIKSKSACVRLDP